MTADGERVRASATENPELLWALRGGGGNFGVVTALELTLHPVGPEVLAGIVLYPQERAGELLRAFRDVMRDAPDELSLAYITLTIPDEPRLPGAVNRPSTVAVRRISALESAAADLRIATFTAWESGFADFFDEMPYTDFQCMRDNQPGYQNFGSRRAGRTTYRTSWVDTIVARCNDKPGVPSAAASSSAGAARWRGSGHAALHTSPSTARASYMHPLSL